MHSDYAHRRATHSRILSAVATSGWTLLAFILLIWVDAVMKLRGFKTIHGLLARITVDETPRHDDGRIQGTCVAVDRAASLYFKRAWCLQRSIVMVMVLRMRGIPAELVIGARKMPFYAHAWVEMEGEVISDDELVKMRYRVLERCSATRVGRELEHRRDQTAEQGVKTSS